MNRKGEFNVPFGQRVNLIVCDEEAIRRASEALQGADILCQDFAAALRRTRRGDFVFADPPYTVAHGNNGFAKYNERIFSWKDQQRLHDMLDNLSARGVFVMLTNADHPSVRKLYRTYKVRHLTRSSVMAANPRHRGPVAELLITNYGSTGLTLDS